MGTKEQEYMARSWILERIEGLTGSMESLCKLYTVDLINLYYAFFKD